MSLNVGAGANSADTSAAERQVSSGVQGETDPLGAPARDSAQTVPKSLRQPHSIGRSVLALPARPFPLRTFLSHTSLEMLEPPEPPPFDRSLMPQHPWEKPAIYAANFALGFFIIVIVVFTILGQLPDPKPKAGAESKKGAKSKHGQYTKDEVAKHNKAVRAENGAVIARLRTKAPLTRFLRQMVPTRRTTHGSLSTGRCTT